ncbi:MAG TPA: histidine kinase [Chloroflexota bacterium]|nr:histidine kinase [Chloroflexota bacterium]
MTDEANSNLQTRSPLGDALDSFRQEIASMAEQSKEISLLIKQTADEIDRLTQINREQSSQMRQLQANIDAYPRTEIQQRYTTWQEAQMRLFMQQNQMEQLRNRQANLERSQQMAMGLLEVVDSLTGSMEAGLAITSGSQLMGQGNDSGGQGPVTALIQATELVYHRLSRELQDSAAQMLSDLILRAEICERLVDRDPSMAKGEISQLRQATAQALKSVRKLIQALEPPALKELGLPTALRRYVSAEMVGESPRVLLEINGKERRLPHVEEIGVFRILQEGLTNAVQHSGGECIKLTLHFETDRVTAQLSDDGHGFDVATALKQATTRIRSGLVEMRVRADSIGASLEINSYPGRGCTINLALPA